ENSKKKNRNKYPCWLFLTEGNGGVNAIKAGIAAIPDGRKKYGIMPIRGKSINVRKASEDKLMNNKTYITIIRILGFKSLNKDEESIDDIMEIKIDESKLNYNGIIIAADADDDGKHIIGIILNMFSVYFQDI